MHTAERLADWSLNADITDDARAMMRLSLFDWSACALAGRCEPVARIATAQALRDAGRADALIVGQPQYVPARAAALANGAISHALDYDDTHFAHIGHPSVAVIPTALAVAQQVGATGREFLDAALIGAEASIRVGVWLGRSHYQAGFHQTGTAGAFGATIAAARLLGLSAEKTGHALGLVSTRAAGLRSQFGTMGKPLNAGFAAANGVECARLAADGLVSAPVAMDGALGFGPTHSGAQTDEILLTDGDGWMIESISHKFHACCHGLHAMLEALDLLRGDTTASHVTITSNPRWKSVCNVENPRAGLQSKFSFRHAAALKISGYDTASLDSFSDATTRRDDLAKARARVIVRFDPAISETAAQVVATGPGGDETRADYDLSDPMDMSERTHRLHVKASALLGATKARALWSIINSGPDLDALANQLSGQT